MKVRILSGNLKGQVVEQSRPEAEANISMGFAEAVLEETRTPEIPHFIQKPKRTSKPSDED